MAYDIGKAFNEMEKYLIDDMIRMLSHHIGNESGENMDFIQWQAEKLKGMTQYKQDNKELFKNYKSKMDKDIDKYIRLSKKTGKTDAEIKILEQVKAGKIRKPIIKKGSNAMQGNFMKINERKMKALINETQGSIGKAEASIMRKVDDQYRKIIFNSHVNYESGMTLDKSIDKSTKDFMKKGISTVEYSNGAIVNVADYSRMALKTASTRAYLQGEAEMRDEWNINTVMVAPRSVSCPKCVKWVNKVYYDDVFGSMTVTDDKYPKLSEAMSGGLYHPNCKDTHTTYFEGISDPPVPMTKAQVRESDKIYQLQQQQRYNERNIRNYKRLEHNAIDYDEKVHYGNKVKEWKKRNDKFITDNDKYLRRDYAREKVIFNFTPPPKPKPPRTPPVMPIKPSMTPPKVPVTPIVPITPIKPVTPKITPKPTPPITQKPLTARTMDQQHDEWWDKLSQTEKDIVQNDVVSHSYGNNRFLRGNENLKLQYDKRIGTMEYERIKLETETMDNIIARFGETETDQVMYRAMSNQDLNKMIKLPAKYGIRDTRSKVLKKLTNQKFVDNGFMNCSLDVNEAQLLYQNYGSRLKINAPKGTKGAYVSTLGGRRQSKEFILARGYEYKIVDYTEIDKWSGLYEIEVDIVKMKGATIPVNPYPKVATAMVGDKVTRNYDNEMAREFGAKHYDGVHDLIDSSDGNIKAKKVWQHYENEIQIADIKYKKIDHHSEGSLYLNMNKIAKGESVHAPYQVVLHETGHNIDWLYAKQKRYNTRLFSEGYKDDIFAKTICDEVEEMTKKAYVKYEAEFLAHADDIQWLVDNKYLSAYEHMKLQNRGIKTATYSEANACEKLRDVISIGDTIPRTTSGDLSDILHGASYTKLHLGVGHDLRYWNSRTKINNNTGKTYSSGAGTEAFAEMFNAELSNPKSIELIKKHLPKSHAIFEEMLDEIVKGLNL